jgi:hypothetical protein
VPVADIATRENDVGDVAMSMGNDPACNDLKEGLESGSCENRRELM